MHINVCFQEVTKIVCQRVQREDAYRQITQIMHLWRRQLDVTQSSSSVGSSFALIRNFFIWADCTVRNRPLSSSHKVKNLRMSQNTMVYSGGLTSFSAPSPPDLGEVQQLCQICMFRHGHYKKCHVTMSAMRHCSLSNDGQPPASFTPSPERMQSGFHTASIRAAIHSDFTFVSTTSLESNEWNQGMSEIVFKTQTKFDVIRLKINNVNYHTMWTDISVNNKRKSW